MDNLYGSTALTQRERRLVRLIAQGLRNRDIAEECGTTENVIKNRIRVVYDKLGLWSRLEVALWHEARKMAALTSTEPCPRCGGDGHIASGPVIGGTAMVKTCPKCGGTGKVAAEKEHSHFDPTELRK